jgi:hypothetical protein
VKPLASLTVSEANGFTNFANADSQDRRTSIFSLKAAHKPQHKTSVRFRRGIWEFTSGGLPLIVQNYGECSQVFGDPMIAHG